MNEVKPLRCAIYTRKSVEDSHHKEQNSLESQRILCEQYAQRRGWEIIPTLYEDYGKTGANMERPGLQKLFADIRAGKIDCVLVHKLDRFSRTLLDFINVLHGLFTTHQVAFVSVTESFNTSTPQGVLVMNVLASYAQYEREQTSLRVKDKIRTSRMQGIWTGGFIPFGYKSVDHKLVLNEQTAAFARSVFEDYIQGQSLQKIAERLNAALGDLPPFTPGKLRTLIRAPICKGYLRSTNGLHKGRHEPLVSGEVWQQANDKLRRNRFGSSAA